MENNSSVKERIFSVEVKSRRDLKTVSLTSGSNESVVLEGTLGEFVQAYFTEGVILEVVGKNGILRVDLKENEITKNKNQQREKTQ